MTDPRRNLDDRLRGNYRRFSTMALKLTLILAIMDWADEGMHNTPRLTTAHWVRGQMLAEEYRTSVHRLFDELSIGVDVKNEKKVLDFIAGHPARCWREVTQGSRRDAGSPDRRWGH
mgnify:CR=1 FL=1